MTRPEQHTQATEKLARGLRPEDVFDWIVTAGYYPEAYVLPPCFQVVKRKPFGFRHFPIKGKSYRPDLTELEEIHFPKTDLTDRNFGIMNPEIHKDIALEIAENWAAILKILFKPGKRVHAYSFPIPVTSNSVGKITTLRSGRLIYEFISMAENDLVEEAYGYKYLVHSDVKNFYPSLYTHSIPWAIHRKSFIRKPENRNDPKHFGNRIDKLFQNANDGCTNGIPIGPAVSDLIAEVVLSAVDCEFSDQTKDLDLLCVRFKDDYRILCKNSDDCRTAIKALQKSLRKFNLLLNEEKTVVKTLPEGLFRLWVSRYHRIRPPTDKKKKVSFREFRECFLGVLEIDQECPGTGIVDRFIADISDDNYKPRIPTNKISVRKSTSLLLLLADRRVKAFPKILGFIEAMLSETNDPGFSKFLEGHLTNLIAKLIANTDDNRYLITWILYFMKKHGMTLPNMPGVNNAILQSIRTNRQKIFSKSTDYQLFRKVRKTRLKAPLLKYLDVFEPQWNTDTTKL
ncbi:MAG: RNA-directed DNA polymerase [Opitutales bacterium]